MHYREVEHLLLPDDLNGDNDAEYAEHPGNAQEYKYLYITQNQPYYDASKEVLFRMGTNLLNEEVFEVG